MSAVGFDIRIPLGWLFVVLGAMLVLWGLIASSEIYSHSLGININLIWGVVMLIFGVVCLVLARRSMSR